MAFFTAIGVISNDIVRRETKNGVVTTFRLETGARRGRKLWIDVECWGHLAGTIAHHGETGRSVAVSGRLTSSEWRDRTSGQRRSRLLVVASHADLLSEGLKHPLSQNQVVAVGKVLDSPTVSEATHRGNVLSFTLYCTHRVSRIGAFKIACESWWHQDIEHVPEGQLSVWGSLAHTAKGQQPVLSTPYRELVDRQKQHLIPSET